MAWLISIDYYMSKDVSEMRGGGILVFALLLLVYIFEGPSLAKMLSTTTQEVIKTLTPVVMPVLLVILVVLVVKFYWTRFRS